MQPTTYSHSYLQLIVTSLGNRPVWGGNSRLYDGAQVGLSQALRSSPWRVTETVAPRPLDSAFALVAENASRCRPIRSAPYGCCLTLSGSLTFAAATYDLRTSHRNKNNGITFDNSEQGTYTRQGNTLRFTRTGGGGEGFPYLLGPGTVSADNETVTLLYGDEGPGSNQIRATFTR
jgi:hypothetical protein